MLHLTQILLCALCCVSVHKSLLVAAFCCSLSGIGWRQPKIVYKYIKFQTKLPQTQQQQKYNYTRRLQHFSLKKVFVMLLLVRAVCKVKTQLSSVIESS